MFDIAFNYNNALIKWAGDWLEEKSKWKSDSYIIDSLGICQERG